MNNTPEQDRLYSKLRVLLRLSKEGVGDEKHNALRMLTHLMSKHEVEWEDFDPDATPPKYEKSYVYKDQWTKDLYIQVICTVTNTWGENVARYRGAKGVLGRTWVVEATRAEHLEIERLFDIYYKALKAMVDAIGPAFYAKNNLYPDAPPPEISRKKKHKMTQQEADALEQMFKNIKPTQIHKGLTHDPEPSQTA